MPDLLDHVIERVMYAWLAMTSLLDVPVKDVQLHKVYVKHCKTY